MCNKRVVVRKRGGVVIYHAETEREKEDANEGEEFDILAKLCRGAGFHHGTGVEELGMSCQQGGQDVGITTQRCVQKMRWGEQLTPSLMMVMRSSFS